MTRPKPTRSAAKNAATAEQPPAPGKGAGNGADNGAAPRNGVRKKNVPKQDLPKTDLPKNGGQPKKPTAKAGVPPKNAVSTKNAASTKPVPSKRDAAAASATPLGAPADAARRPVTTGGPAADRFIRYLLLVVVFVLGVVVGAVGTFGHRAGQNWGGVSWPTGLVLCLGGLVGLLLALGELLAAGVPDSWLPTRLPGISWASAGWLVALLWLTYVGPPWSFARKGDILLPNDAKSMIFLLGGMLLVTVAIFRAWTATLAARLAQRPGAAERGHSKG